MLAILDSLPQFLSTKNLIDLGLYKNRDSAYIARLQGNSPDYIKFGRKILYPKQSVLTFLNLHLATRNPLKK